MTISHRALVATCLLVPPVAGSSFAGDVNLSDDALPPGAVARLGGKQLRHSGVIQDIEYAPDGKRLESASDSIRVWDAASGKMIHEMARRPGTMIRSFAISPDGRAVAFPGGLSAIEVLESATGRAIHALSGHKPFSECAAFSPEGKVLATGGTDSLGRNVTRTDCGPCGPCPYWGRSGLRTPKRSSMRWRKAPRSRESPKKRG